MKPCVCLRTTPWRGSLWMVHDLRAGIYAQRVAHGSIPQNTRWCTDKIYCELPEKRRYTKWLLPLTRELGTAGNLSANDYLRTAEVMQDYMLCSLRWLGGANQHYKM